MCVPQLGQDVFCLPAASFQTAYLDLQRLFLGFSFLVDGHQESRKRLIFLQAFGQLIPGIFIPSKLLCQSQHKLQARLSKLEKMEKNLQQLAIEEKISFADFKDHRNRIESERARLNVTVDAIKQRQHLVKADFEIALDLATKLNFFYEKGGFDERRLLCEVIFKRINVKDGKIATVDLNAPFCLIASQAAGSGTVTFGGAGGIRTPYLLTASQTFSRVNYGPRKQTLI